MRRLARWAGRLAVAGIVLVPFPTAADTIAAGEVRVVSGTISAVDVTHRAVVVDAPVAAGQLTVGVTLAPSVSPEGPSGPVPLADLQPGSFATLRYTRENDRLVGLALKIQR